MLAAPVRRQPPRLHLVERQHQPLDRVLGGGDLRRAHLREILFLQHLAIGHGEARVDLELAASLLAACRSAGNSASWTRCAPGLGCSGCVRRRLRQQSSHAACRDSRALARKCGTPDRTGTSARAASRTPRAASSRNPRACRRRRLAPPRAHRAPRPARPGCPPRAARGRNRRCFRRAGRFRLRHHRRYSAARNSARTWSSSSLGLAAFDARDVVLIFQQHAERVGHGRRIERDRVELGQRGRPVERLGDAGRLEQILLAQRLHEMHDLLATASCRCPAPWRARSSSSRSAFG